MAKKNIKNKVEITGEFQLRPELVIKDDGLLPLEYIIARKLIDTGYETYSKVKYKIILEYKKE
jgi:hypothetical protein